MTLPRRRSLLAFLLGLFVLLAVATVVTADSQETGIAADGETDEADIGEAAAEAEESEEDEEETDDEDDGPEYDPHMAVLIWLKNRADYAEKTIFTQPWKDYDHNHPNEDYQYQNGYFFAHNKLRLVTGYNDDTLDEETANESSPLRPRIVATQTIRKGDLLVGVPSTALVYKQERPLKPAYKILHPCDVTSKLLSARTYRYPSNGEEEKRGLPALPNFVRPFIDSLLALTQISETELVGLKGRHLWTVQQLTALKSILGNELAPKANTLVLWGDTQDKEELPMLCQHPNPQDLENNKITDHFFDPTNPRAAEFQRLFRSAVAIVVTKSWNNRMVPIYHWIPRSDDFNSVHSERRLDPESMHEDFVNWDPDESADAPSVYEIHASRDIAEGEELVLPYHSVAQKFAMEGKIDRSPETKETHYRFWTQTLHDEIGPDLLYSRNKDNPYDVYLSWDYYPKTQTIRWVVNPWDPYLEFNTLRSSQRSVLHAQYMRLRGMETQVQKLIQDNPDDVGTLAIVEYYELWVESLGVLLANARPNRNSKEGKCVSTADPYACLEQTDAPTSEYDDLLERSTGNGDPINYNNFIASHECDFKFKQSKYEDNDTPYAHLEWSRSYIGGGSINDHRGDEEAQEADEREQDTCLFLQNVLHSCLSFRPHVHETLIHYPASFLPKNGMKRVLYVGGGDLVLLHELLRYKSVELVIGMELDQAVLRNSFRHYGIQPKFEDERVHWWFGDAAKSLSLLPPDEYFGTFDMVLIDLVTEIFDVLRVGQHNERLVDYMAKLLKPEGILVRQEDWPIHNLVDFAKYTVDLNLFGMPHTCSQYFTMASNTIDFANHERVDHELEDLVWYDPEVDSHNHTKMWAAYRNNLDPPERICKSTEKQPTHVLPSKGLFVAIEAEDLTMNLGDVSLVQSTAMKTLEEVGFTKIEHHDIMVDEDASFSSMLFVFEEGYLMIRSFPEQKFASMDLQLWNDFSKKEITVSTLVGAFGGDVSSDSTSTFYITTGGMFGVSNVDDHSTPLVPSAWCEGESKEPSTSESLTGLETATEEILNKFVDTKKEDYTVLLLCANDEAPCKALSKVKFGPNAEVFSFNACGSESSLNECEDKMRATIEETLSQTSGATKKIRAIIIDPEVPKELGQVATKLFVNNPSSFNWVSHDFVVLAPSASNTALASSSNPSSWRYQLLERFRTDMIEINPVYHATVALRDASSEWAMGFLSAGNTLFYGHLKDSMDAIRGSPGTEIQEVILVETLTGAISHIPDYQPSKWATPSDYDIKPAEEQYSQQKPVGVQLVVQHEFEADLDGDEIRLGDKILMFLEQEQLWCPGYVDKVISDEFDDVSFLVRTAGSGDEKTLDMSDIIKFDFDDETQPNSLPFGSLVLADALEEDVKERYFHKAQITGMHKDGRYKIYYLDDGSVAYLKPNEVAMQPFGFFKSPEDAKMFESCEEFFQLVKDRNRGSQFRRELGDGCMTVISWPRNGEITTLVATYDGQIHMDFNVYSSVDLYEKNSHNSLVTIMEERDIEETNKIQTDFFPRGHNRVVNFRHDLEAPYFGTKYPPSKSEI